MHTEWISEHLDCILEKILEEEKHIHRVAWKDVSQNPWINFTLLWRCSKNFIYIQKFLTLHPSFPYDRFLEIIPTPSKNDWCQLTKKCPVEDVLSSWGKEGKHWVFSSLCYHPDMTASLLQKHIIPFLSHEIIQTFFADSAFFHHPNFSWNDLHKFPFHKINYRLLSRHPHFDHTWLFAIPRKHWEELDWNHLSRTLPFSFIENYFLQLPWVIRDLSHHPRLSIQLVLRFRKKKWDWDGISQHISLSDAWSFRKRISLRFRALSKNLHLRPWFVREFLGKRWDRVELAMNPALRPSNIFQDPILFPMWRWDHCLKNPAMDSVTLGFLLRQLPFSIHIYLLKNCFTQDPILRQTSVQTIVKFFRYRLAMQKQTYCLHLLRKIHKRFPTEIWWHIVSFI